MRPLPSPRPCLVTLAALGLLAGGCDAQDVSAEVEIPRVCYALAEFELPAAGAGDELVGRLPIDTTFRVNVGSMLNDADLLNGDVYLLSADFSASGESRLDGWLESAQFRVNRGGAAATSLLPASTWSADGQLLTLTHPELTEPGAFAQLAAEQPARLAALDLYDTLEGQQLELTLGLVLTRPPSNTRLKTTACFRLRADLDVGEQL